MDGVIYFEPPVARAPTIVPSPFDPGEPHPLARRAADQLLAWLRGHTAGEPGGAPHALDAPGAAVHGLESPGGGKMFGVLVVAAPDGRIGYLRGFSGMLGGAWHVSGFVPPLFDVAARDAFWPAAERRLGEIDHALRALDASPDRAALRVEQAAGLAHHAAELTALRTRHRERRATRHAARRALGAAVAAAVDPRDPRGVARERAPSSGDGQTAALHALDQASRGDAAERRRLLAAHAAQRAAWQARLSAIDGERDRLAHQRAAESRGLMKRLHDTYVIRNARGECRSLRDLFAPGEPPSGAGDCAAPKLIGHAYRLGLAPLALAELWWGAPPATGGRHAGQFYPACRGKCGPLLPFMLEGLAVAAAPVFGGTAVDAPVFGAAVAGDAMRLDHAPGGQASIAEPRIVFEDEWLIVVDKPCGLLSVPGRGAELFDSVVTRLRARHAGVLAVHRLDLDTSGLLVVAKDPQTHAQLQRAFARREVAKRYVAWLDGSVPGDRGTIELPLRVDLDDRPRQIVDFAHGKPATTRWRVVDRTATSTRVQFFPRTGRSHQLRVHAAHPLGLGAPIVGDRLYGRAAARLALHAEALAFLHPHTGRRIALAQAAPF